MDDRQDPPVRQREGFPGQRLVIVPPQIVRRALAQPVTRDLCVTHIGHFGPARGHYVDRPRGSPQFVFFLCLSGAGTATLGGRCWPMEGGHFIVLPPHRAHTYEADRRAPWTIFWVHFGGARAADYAAALGSTSADPLGRVDDVDVLFEAFEDTFRHVTHGFSEAALIGLSTAFARLLGLARVHQRAEGRRARRAEARLVKVIARLRDQPEHPWTAAELAAQAGMSVPHFSALFRRQTGIPPMTYLIRLRLQRALGLLQHGEHNVAEAARAVGYEDPFYFSRLFRKHLGVPPSSCRQGP